MLNNQSFKAITDSIVSITRFNRGEAGKIFEEVRSSGSKIVFKNNTPECVLVDPTTYEGMLDLLEDYALFFEAEERMRVAGKTGTLTHEQVLDRFGISESDLDDTDDVEIE